MEIQVMTSTESFDVLFQATRGVLTATKSPCVLFFDDARRNLVGKPDYVYGFIVRASSYDQKFPAPSDLSDGAARLWGQHDFAKTFDGASGISVNAIIALRNLIPHSKICCIALDWDLTLSQHRAIIRDAITRKTVNYAAECFFGGQRRKQEIAMLFAHAKRKGVPIRIVTSNPAAHSTPELFTMLLKTVNGGWIPVVYSSSKMTYVRENHKDFRIL